MSIFHFLQDLALRLFGAALSYISPDMANLIRLASGQSLLPVYHERVFALAALVAVVAIIYQVVKGNNPVKLTRVWIAKNAHGVVLMLTVFTVIALFDAARLYCVSGILSDIALLCLVVIILPVFAVVEANKERVSLVVNKPFVFYLSRGKSL